jgi:hypothetical protein
MYEHDHQEFSDEQPIDEHEIEIFDLPEDNQPEKKIQHASSNRTHPHARARKISLGPRLTLRQRRRQAIITGIIMLTALIIFLVSILPVQTLFKQLTSPSLMSGPNLFYFPQLPSWGTFTLDGRRLTSTPTVDSGPPVQLSEGTHTLVWRGEPFVPLQCTLVVPSFSERQTCSVRDAGSNEYTRDASMISFPIGLSLQQLPQNERTALTRTLQNVLDELQSSSIVQPGERYSYSLDGQVYTARNQLRAFQSFDLDTDADAPAECMGPRFGSGCSLDGTDCRLLCSVSWPTKASDPATQGWHVVAVVDQTWEYSDVGQSFLTQPNAPGDQHQVTFQITRVQHQWRAAFHPQGASPFDDPNCIGVVGQITSSPKYLQLDETQQRITWTYSSGPNRASGCLATGTVHSGTTLDLPTSANSTAYLLYRFDQLQAANEPARQLWPMLPLADKHTQDIASQIATHPAFVS